MKRIKYLILILFLSIISINGQIIEQLDDSAINCEIKPKTELNSSLTTNSLFYPIKAYVDYEVSYPGGSTDTINFIYSPERILVKKTLHQKTPYGDEYYSQRIFTYDQSNLLTEEINQRLLNGNWENTQKYVYNYDASKNLLEKQNQKYENDIWIPIETNTFVYDSNNNLLEKQYKKYENDIWIPIKTNTFMYDSNNNLLEKQYKKYENDIWIPIETNTFVYDSNNKLIEQYYKQWDTNWIDVYQYLYLYNSSDQLIEKKINDFVDGNWVFRMKCLYAYYAQGQIGAVSYYNGDGYLLSYDEYTYSGGLLTFIQNMMWEYFHLYMGSYVAQNWLEYRYDNYENCNYATYSIKIGYGSHVKDRTFNLLYNNGSSSLSLDGARVQVIYSTLTDVNESEISVVDKFSLSQNYPNPFNPNTTISFSLPKQEFVTLKIYDILGKEIATLFSEELKAGTYQKDWQPKGLSSGIYFYRLQAGKYTETHKMSFLK
ncbi:MAG: T9SS type A sorting domain-containing protein [bacterium]